MIDDREIWACAHQLMKQHGNLARDEVSNRADALLVAGELDGHRTFLRIINCIRRLECQAPVGAVH
jgi:hypothetical protein